MDHIYFAEGSKMMDGLGEGQREGVDETQTSKTIGESHWDALLEFRRVPKCTSGIFSAKLYILYLEI